MAEQRTCGQGLAEHSVLTAKLGELTDAVASNLEVHMKALDLDDGNAKKEHGVYLKLAKEHRQVAARLQAVAAEMAGNRDLAMGRHDRTAMVSPEVLEAFERFVKAELELLALLQERVEQDQTMLLEMARAGGGGT